MQPDAITSWLENLTSPRLSNKRKRSDSASHPMPPRRSPHGRKPDQAETQSEKRPGKKVRGTNPDKANSDPCQELESAVESNPLPSVAPSPNRIAPGHSPGEVYASPILTMGPPTERPRPSTTGSAYGSSKRSSSGSRVGAPDTASPLYRKMVLRDNGVAIRKFSDPLPTTLSQEVTRILQRKCLIMEAFDINPTSLKNEIADAADAAEGSMTAPLIDEVFPRKQDCPTHSKLEQRTPFVRAALPCGRPEWRHTIRFSISCPVPDMTYGYEEEDDLSLSRVERLEAFGLQEISMTTKELFRPYFTAEFKPSSSGQWAASNQAAGAGATCVNVAKALHNRASAGEDGHSTLVSTMAFSATVVSTAAKLWVHWSEPDSHEIQMACVRSYELHNTDDLILFRAHVYQVIDWGLTERYWTHKRWLRVLADEAERLDAVRAAGLASNP